MKIVIATPLYPPDIAPSAQYVKELAKRLVESGYSITIIAYAHTPEKVPCAQILTVNKNRPLPLRMFAYLFALWRAARATDIIYVQNGASVELPATLVSLVARAPIIIGISDKNACKYAKKNVILKFVNYFIIKRARKTITDIPMERPEILPFSAQPADAQETYRLSWENHMHTLIQAFNYA